MLWYLNSKTFFDVFLKNEKYQTIKNTFYVIVSDRIRREQDVKNIVIHKTFLPSAHCYSMGTAHEMRTVYLNEIDKNEQAYVFLASLIKECIVNGTHIVFITTKVESKIHFFNWLEEYIYSEFEYPFCDYKKYIETGYLLDFDPNKVLKKVKKITQKAERELESRFDINTKIGRRRLQKHYKDMTKKQLIKKVKSMDLYYDGMTKDEMLDMIEAFSGIS